MSSAVNPMTIDIVMHSTILSSLAIVCVITLLIILAQKLLAAATDTPLAHSLNLALNAILVPLILAFVMITISRIHELLESGGIL